MISYDAVLNETPDSPAGTTWPQAEVLPAAFDLVPVKRSLARYDAEMERMVAMAKSFDVVDDATRERAVEMAGQAKKLDKAVEAERATITKPAFDFKKSVDALAKGYRDKLAGIVTGLTRKVGAYNQAQEIKRREAERKAQEAAREIQKRIDAEAAAAGVETVIITPPVIPETPKITRTAEGSCYERKTWTWELADFEYLPNAYKIPNKTALDAAVRSGAREIAGVRIFEKVDTILRT